MYLFNDQSHVALASIPSHGAHGFTHPLPIGARDWYWPCIKLLVLNSQASLSQLVYVDGIEKSAY